VHRADPNAPLGILQEILENEISSQSEPGHKGLLLPGFHVIAV
jgi:hypothetical protein